MVVALVVGSVQAALQHWLAVPIILAAEVLEEATSTQRSEPSAHQEEHSHNAVHATQSTELPNSHDHDEVAKEWAPAGDVERTFWTWVATVIDTLALGLLSLAAIAASLASSNRRGNAPVPALLTGLLVAAAGWFGLHLWPALGLPAELPGMEAADLGSRQAWWLMSAVSALGTCVLLAFSRKSWRWPLAALLLVLPFLIGAPHLTGDPLGAFGPEAQMQMRALEARFSRITHLLAVTQWLGIGLLGGWLFGRWVQPCLGPSTAGKTASPHLTQAS